jgi:hypothetical protein
MIVLDSRGPRLRALDAMLLEFVAHRGPSPSGVGDDGASLCELAVAIAESMSSWSRIMSRVGVASSSTFEPALAGGLAIESVFDGLLDGPSLNLLIAAFDLAMTPR